MSLKDQLAAGKTVITAWSCVPDALTVEIVVRREFDAVTLDMQHGGHNEDSVLRSIPSVLARDKPAIVRIPVGRFDMASRALDFGAEAVIAPMIDTVADAQAFATAMKYPPLGKRSWGPAYAFQRRGVGAAADWLRDGNDRTMAFAMIETRAAYQALDGILDVDGIDGIFVGPSDLSIAWTDGAVMDPGLEDMMEALADIAARATAAGKASAIYVVDPANAGRFAAMGYRLLATGSEDDLITLGAGTLLSGMRGSLGS